MIHLCWKDLFLSCHGLTSIQTDKDGLLLGPSTLRSTAWLTYRLVFLFHSTAFFFFSSVFIWKSFVSEHKSDKYCSWLQCWLKAPCAAASNPGTLFPSARGYPLVRQWSDCSISQLSRHPDSYLMCRSHVSWDLCSNGSNHTSFVLK